MSVWWPGEWDRLISKFEDWIVKRNGYSKLQPMILSRGYQTLVNKRNLNERSCTTFRFTNVENRHNSKIALSKPRDARGSYTYKPSSVEITKDINEVPELCLSSLDKMEAVLKQYEKAFCRLQKRGPKRSNTVISHNFDLLNEDVIQNIFLKCYNGNRTCHEIATSKV